ncbi:MAG: ferrochelatase [Methylococcaceae bacterium]|jgi:ferrochelatase
MAVKTLGSEKKTGILLVNLGSPSAPTVSAVRKFLRQFLGDPRVVNLPRFIWWIILNAFVLPFRPKKSAKAYQKVWTDQGSPLTFFTRQLTENVRSQLTDKTILIEFAMRYGEPSIAQRLASFKEQGMDALIVLPLYPQYSSTTSASIYDDLIKELNQWRHLPSFKFISDYHQDVHYIAAVAASISQKWQTQGKNALLVMSFHGLPKQLTAWGDPYFYHCQNTAQLIANKLNLEAGQWQLVFQSRFGKAEWLQPYCLETLENLPKQGIKSVDVVCPGFAVDCLETLEEIAIANKAAFIAAGGETYHYIPALNDTDTHVGVMLNLLAQNT